MRQVQEEGPEVWEMRLAPDEDDLEEAEQLEPQEQKRKQVSVCPQKQSQIYLQSVEQKISPNIGPLYKVLCIEEIKEALRRCPGGKQTPHPAEVEVEVEEPHDVEEVRRDLRLLAQLDGENPRRNFRAFEELAW